MASHVGGWRVAVSVTALLAGLLFATTAATAQGTDLRGGRFTQLADLITAQRAQLQDQERVATALRRTVAAVQADAATGDSQAAGLRAEADVVAPGAGILAASGPGVTVSLNDAVRREGLPAASTNPDDLVVHQQDVQAVVNGLWAGGAEAMTLMGQRVISTSAVRCVGNTIVLHGRVYGPPFVVKAIGDPAALRTGLAAEPGVEFFRTFVDRYGLGYSVTENRRMTLPAYEGPLDLPHVLAGP